MKNWINLKEEIIDKGYCTSCGTCIGVCPEDVIYFDGEKIKGNIENCINCGLCIKVCPGKSFDFKKFNKELFNVNYKDLNMDLGYYNAIYRGYSNNPLIRRNSASGGITTSILVYLLENKIIDGAITISKVKNLPYKFDVKISVTVDEIIRSSQSKYVLIPTNKIIKQLRQLKGRYAYIGLPCQIQGMRKLEKICLELTSKICIYIGLFCGFNMYFEGTEFLIKKMGIKKDDIEKLEYRAKENITGFRVITKSNKKYFIDKDSYNYLNILYSPKRCWLCYDFTSEFADISIGDAWGKNGKGWSRVIVRTAEGKKIIDELLLNENIYLEKSEENDIYTTQKQLLKYKKKWFWLRTKLMANIPNYNLPQKKLSLCENFIAFLFYLCLLIGKNKILRGLIYVVPIKYINKISKIMCQGFKKV